jgi:creatinine amidohydrolase
MENYIRKMSGKQYLKRMDANPLVIVPTGACEVYGPHMPMGTDLIVAKRISELVAEKTDAIIAPTIEMGESSALGSYPCTFALPRKILEEYLDFLVGKLLSDGAKKFLFINGHAGNVDTINYIVKKYMNKNDFKAAQVDWWRFATVHNKGICQYEGAMCNGHAAECGTSVMAYLFPEYIDKSEITVSKPRGNNEFSDFIVLKKFTDKTDNGMIGDATVYSKEKGQKIVEKCVNRILEFVNSYYK